MKTKQPAMIYDKPLEEAYRGVKLTYTSATSGWSGEFGPMPVNEQTLVAAQRKIDELFKQREATVASMQNFPVKGGERAPETGYERASRELREQRLVSDAAWQETRDRLKGVVTSLSEMNFGMARVALESLIADLPDTSGMQTYEPMLDRLREKLVDRARS